MQKDLQIFEQGLNVSKKGQPESKNVLWRRIKGIRVQSTFFKQRYAISQYKSSQYKISQYKISQYEISTLSKTVGRRK